ncbi:MAG: HIT family protein [bacterium]
MTTPSADPGITPDCVFCDIMAGTVPATVVYEDARCIVFMDARPVTLGHVLVVPREHVASFHEVDSDTAAHMMRVAHRMDQALRASAHRCEGVYVLMWDGVGAGQEVFHVHMHVFPAYRNDGFGLQFPPGFGRKPAREELEDAAGLVRAGLASLPPE